jgi:hypothetical protein
LRHCHLDLSCEISLCGRNDTSTVIHLSSLLSSRPKGEISNHPSLKSFHSGLTATTRLSFFSRRHFLISFSLAIAARTSLGGCPRIAKSNLLPQYIVCYYVNKYNIMWSRNHFLSSRTAS